MEETISNQALRSKLASTDKFNKMDIVAMLETLFSPGDVFEIRLLDAVRRDYLHPHVESGYFKYEDIDTVLEALDEIRSAMGVYVTMNPVNPDLFARSANRLKPAKRGDTTADRDIVRRRWLLFDIDSDRVSGISATDEEKRFALEKAIEIRDGLGSFGWPEPLMIDSGNGYYLMYQVDLPTEDGGLVRKCIQALQPVATEAVHIDVSVCNPARLCRLPGTWNCKGDDIPERPHRMAGIYAMPEQSQVVSKEKLHLLIRDVVARERFQPVADERDGLPGNDFNERGELEPILRQHGWQYLGNSGENQHWRRPGKTSGTLSATYNGQTFYVFSSNAQPFEAYQGYSRFSALAHLEHGGDFTAAARALGEAGYGSTPDDSDVDLSCFMQSQPSSGLARFEPKTLRERLDEFTGLNRPIIRGLLREGETMNVIASPKVGKSWLASSLGISVACGLDWLGFGVEQGAVLHVDNELHANTSTYRYRVVGEAMGVSERDYRDKITTVSLRGKLADMNVLGLLFEEYPADAFKIVIIDAFYRALPSGVDENDNGAIALLYNTVDRYAAHLGCAFVLIHHSSKGNQSGKSVTDVGAGAGSQARAVDTHLVLRPHAEQGITVMEAAVRSFKPVEPLALSWNWPLFRPVHGIDTSVLLGLIKPKAEKKEVPIETFVETCVAGHDPCSQTLIVHESTRRFDLPKSWAKETLALAVEGGLVVKTRLGSSVNYVKTRPGVSGEKGQLVAALLAHHPELSVEEIVERAKVSPRYASDIRKKLLGIESELEKPSSKKTGV